MKAPVAASGIPIAESAGIWHSDSSATPVAGRERLVSVVIPCYNCETFLAEAIESALRQSHSEVEILVVDNGSTDRSAQIAQQYPLRYLRLEERNLCQARNLGIRESLGAYIVFLDADDRLRPNGIELGLRLLERQPECAIAVGNHVFISEHGSWLADSNKPCLPTHHFEALLRSNFIEMISSVLFRRGIFDRIGAFDPSLPSAEDYDLYLRIAREFPIFCHESVIAEYRIHDTNISKNSEMMLASSLRVLERQRSFLAGNARWESAFAYGARCWRRRYGRQLAVEMSRSNYDGQGEEYRRKLRMLTRQYPLGVAILMLLRMLPPGIAMQLLGRRQALRASAALQPAMHTPPLAAADSFVRANGTNGSFSGLS